MTSHDVVAAGAPRAAARHQGGARRHARPLRHRPAARAGRAAPRARSASSWRCPRPTAPWRGWAGARTRATATGALEHTGRVPGDLRIPLGEQLQRPPAYSAVKLGGKRAYELARRGETPELEPRPVTVYRAEVIWQEAERAAFEIECSAGTYVRALISDLGDAYCERLERTAIGPFRLEDADDERADAARRRALVPARAPPQRGRRAGGAPRAPRSPAARRGRVRCGSRPAASCSASARFAMTRSSPS